MLVKKMKEFQKGRKTKIREVRIFLEGGFSKNIVINISGSMKINTQFRIKLTLMAWSNTSTKLTAAAAKSLQSCPTLCDPIDGSPPGSPVPWILQARTLEWVAISFSNAWKWDVKVNSLSRVQLLATPWTAAHQATLPMEFSRQETGVGCHCLLRAQN